MLSPHPWPPPSQYNGRRGQGVPFSPFGRRAGLTLLTRRDEVNVPGDISLLSGLEGDISIVLHFSLNDFVFAIIFFCRFFPGIIAQQYAPWL